MKMKNDCQVDYIKEAFDKLYNCVMPFINLEQFSDADTAFKELDRKVHSEIYILKKCLAESDRAVEAGITRSKVLQERIHELEEENASLRVTSFDTIDGKEKEINDLKKKIQYLETELAQARNSTELHLRKENDRLRKVVDTLEKEINTLKKNIHELEEETADDAIRIKSLERANSVLRGDNKILCLSPGHEFEFGDEVFVPWSCDPYMYVKSGMMYNPRTERLVYVGKDQHLKWFGDKFAIV